MNFHYVVDEFPLSTHQTFAHAYECCRDARRYDAFESLMHTLGRRGAVRRGRTPPPFGWGTPALSCLAAASSGAAGASTLDLKPTPPLSQQPSPWS